MIPEEGAAPEGQRNHWEDCTLHRARHVYAARPPLWSPRAVIGGEMPSWVGAPAGSWDVGRPLPQSR